MEKTDGIVIFTGEIDRETAAWQLYHQGLAEKFHISGRYIGFPKNRYPAAITVDFAPNTLRNVQLTEQWIRWNHLRSIRLVTADYHMPRCLLLAGQLWPKIKVFPHPVHVVHDADHPEWLILWAEYIRYILASIGCSIRCFKQ